MVTHSAMAASYASRVLFIKDGEIFAQLYRGDGDNRAFFDRIVSNLSVLSEGVRMLGNGFYRKMAAGNIRRSREVYLPTCWRQPSSAAYISWW